MAELSGVWASHARSWSSFGMPQRPCPEDIAIFFELVGAALSHNSLGCSALSDVITHRACVLGVTPELVRGAWPIGSSIYSFDRSADMIAQHWAEHPAYPSSVRQAQWHDLPVEAARFAVIVGDGSTTHFPVRDYYSVFFEEMLRVIQPGGSLFMRCFTSPEIRQSEVEIVRQLKVQQIRHFGALKWRIAMMLADRVSMQVRVHDIVSTFDRLFPDRDDLEAAMGWTRAEIDTIETYRDMETIYTFPTLREFSQLCAPHFEIREVRHGSYELAACCPILTLSPIG